MKAERRAKFTSCPAKSQQLNINLSSSSGSSSWVSAGFTIQSLMSIPSVDISKVDVKAITTIYNDYYKLNDQKRREEKITKRTSWILPPGLARPPPVTRWFQVDDVCSVSALMSIVFPE